jgi:hypothetical protein
MLELMFSRGWFKRTASGRQLCVVWWKPHGGTYRFHLQDRNVSHLGSNVKQATRRFKTNKQTPPSRLQADFYVWKLFNSEFFLNVFNKRLMMGLCLIVNLFVFQYSWIQIMSGNIFLLFSKLGRTLTLSSIPPPLIFHVPSSHQAIGCYRAFLGNSYSYIRIENFVWKWQKLIKAWTRHCP